MRRSTQKQHCSNHPAGKRNADQQNEHKPSSIQMMSEGSAAEGQPGPKRHGICGVRRNWRDSSEQQRGKGNEAAAAGNGVQGAAEHGGKKQQNCVVNAEERKIQAVRDEAVSCWGSQFPKPLAGCGKSRCVPIFAAQALKRSLISKPLTRR